MAARRIDAEIDRLYQLPLDEFTAARNALAKTSGNDGAWVRGLVKPPLAAWAVNQLAWRHRDVYDALVRAAGDMRRAHAAVLAGRKGDVRGAGRAHEIEVENAMKAAVGILEADGHPATDATRQAIATTLRALPGNEPAGRLTRTLQPGGFEMLAGLTIGGKPVAAPVRQMPPPPAPREASPAAKKAPAADPKAVARARESVAAASRLLRDAEHAARREEFERARAEREVEKAEKSLAAARDLLADAERDVEEAEQAVSAAARARDAAAKRADKTEEALESARAGVESAERDLARLSGK